MYVMHGKHFQTLSDLVDVIALDFETEEVDYDLDATDNLSQPNETEGLQR